VILNPVYVDLFQFGIHSNRFAVTDLDAIIFIISLFESFLIDSGLSDENNTEANINSIMIMDMKSNLFF